MFERRKIENPWEGRIEPFKIIGNVYFVIINERPGGFPPGTVICALLAFLVQFIRLAEEDITHRKENELPKGIR